MREKAAEECMRTKDILRVRFCFFEGSESFQDTRDLAVCTTGVFQHYCCLVALVVSGLRSLVFRMMFLEEIQSVVVYGCDKENGFTNLLLHNACILSSSLLCRFCCRRLCHSWVCMCGLVGWVLPGMCHKLRPPCRRL